MLFSLKSVINRIFQLAALVIVTLATFLGSQSLAYSATAQDVISGERIYMRCTGCHSPAYHRTGPKHCGLLGRYAGRVADFEFTPAMKNSGIIWTEETLNQFFRAPLDMMPDTSMGFAGIPSEKERIQLIAFLATLTEENLLCR